MLEGLHAIRRKNRLPPSKNPENLEESVVLRRRNGAAPFSFRLPSGRPSRAYPCLMIEIIDAPFSRDLHPLFQRHARRNLTSVLACSARSRSSATSPPLRGAARLRALRADEGPGRSRELPLASSRTPSEAAKGIRSPPKGRLHSLSRYEPAVAVTFLFRLQDHDHRSSQCPRSDCQRACKTEHMIQRRFKTHEHQRQHSHGLEPVDGGLLAASYDFAQQQRPSGGASQQTPRNDSRACQMPQLSSGAYHTQSCDS